MNKKTASTEHTSINLCSLLNRLSELIDDSERVLVGQCDVVEWDTQIREFVDASWSEKLANE